MTTKKEVPPKAEDLLDKIGKVTKMEAEFSETQSKFRGLEAEVRRAKFDLDSFNRDLVAAAGPQESGAWPTTNIRSHEDQRLLAELETRINKAQAELEEFRPRYQEEKVRVEQARSELEKALTVETPVLREIQANIKKIGERKSRIQDAIGKQESFLQEYEAAREEYAQLCSQLEDARASIEIGEKPQKDPQDLEKAIKEKASSLEGRELEIRQTLSGLRRQLQHLEKEAALEERVFRELLQRFVLKEAETAGRAYLQTTEKLYANLKRLAGLHEILRIADLGETDILGTALEEINIPVFNLAAFRQAPGSSQEHCLFSKNVGRIIEDGLTEEKSRIQKLGIEI